MNVHANRSLTPPLRRIGRQQSVRWGGWGGDRTTAVLDGAWHDGGAGGRGRTGRRHARPDTAGRRRRSRPGTMSNRLRVADSAEKPVASREPRTLLKLVRQCPRRGSGSELLRMNNLRMIRACRDNRRDEPEVTNGPERVRTPRRESTDLKVGGSSPSERTQYPQLWGHSLGCERWPLHLSRAVSLTTGCTGTTPPPSSCTGWAARPAAGAAYHNASATASTDRRQP